MSLSGAKTKKLKFLSKLNGPPRLMRLLSNKLFLKLSPEDRITLASQLIALRYKTITNSVFGETEFITYFFNLLFETLNFPIEKDKLPKFLNDISSPIPLLKIDAIKTQLELQQKNIIRIFSPIFQKFSKDFEANLMGIFTNFLASSIIKICLSDKKPSEYADFCSSGLIFRDILPLFSKTPAPKEYAFSETLRQELSSFPKLCKLYIEKITPLEELANEARFKEPSLNQQMLRIFNDFYNTLLTSAIDDKKLINLVETQSLTLSQLKKTKSQAKFDLKILSKSQIPTLSTPLPSSSASLTPMLLTSSRQSHEDKTIEILDQSDSTSYTPDFARPVFTPKENKFIKEWKSMLTQEIDELTRTESRTKEASLEALRQALELLKIEQAWPQKITAITANKLLDLKTNALLNALSRQEEVPTFEETRLGSKRAKH